MQTLLIPLVVLWGVVHRTGSVAWSLRFNFLSVVLGVAMLVVAAQGRELVEGAKDSDRLFYFLMAAMVIWIFQSFYRARYLYPTHLQEMADTRVERFLIRQAPWALVAASIGVAIQVFLEVTQHPVLKSDFLLSYDEPQLAIWAILWGVAWVVVYLLAKLAPQSWFSGGVLQQSGWFQWIVSYLIPLGIAGAAIIDPVWVGFYFGAGALVFLALSVLSSLGTLIDLGIQKTGLPLVGLLLALAIFSSFSNTNHGLRIVGYEPLVINSVSDVFNRFNGEQTLAPKEDYLVDATRRSSITDAYLDWLLAQEEEGEGRLDLSVVATEGGGIRAAYWTATILGALQDQSIDNGSDFSKSLFAVSGVSGGSVGAVVHNATLLEGGDCTLFNGETREGSFEACSQAALEWDFLGPTTASLFYGDFIQRFIPIPVFTDRAYALERSWEYAWGETFGGGDADNRMGNAFLELWPAGRQTGEWVPALMLNGMHEETGKRVVTSNLLLNTKLDLGEGEERYPFNDVIDFYTDKFDCAIPASTAAHNSARFTYVSPLGDMASCQRLMEELDGCKGETCLTEGAGNTVGHVMDGGYFENFGATSALELLRALDDLLAIDIGVLVKDTPYEAYENRLRRLRDRGVDLAVIQIANETGMKGSLTEPIAEAVQIEVEGGMPIQTKGPIIGILNSRVSRGILATKELNAWVRARNRPHCAGQAVSGAGRSDLLQSESGCGPVSGTAFYLFDLKNSDIAQTNEGDPEFLPWTDPPLGWTLSKESQITICEQLRSGPNRIAYAEIGRAHV